MALYQVGLIYFTHNIFISANILKRKAPFCHLPDLDICAHSKVSWHLLGMSSEPELFSVHFNGQVLLHDGHKTSTVGIISGTATSASMTGIHPGRWLFSSHISRHLEGKTCQRNHKTS